MSFDREGFCKYLLSHAKPTYDRSTCGYCAKAIQDALIFGGGLTEYKRVASAYLIPEELKKMGFRCALNVDGEKVLFKGVTYGQDECARLLIEEPFANFKHPLIIVVDKSDKHPHGHVFAVIKDGSKTVTIITISDYIQGSFFGMKDSVKRFMVFEYPSS
jgi:hypothetical protein